jgi:hypothetical protein
MRHHIELQLKNSAQKMNLKLTPKYIIMNVNSYKIKLYSQLNEKEDSFIALKYVSMDRSDIWTKCE